jgi:hypothetical protein
LEELIILRDAARVKIYYYEKDNDINFANEDSDTIPEVNNE